MQLVRYEQARSALANCVKVDEAKSIRDKAEALRAYGRQAKDHELETWAAEIKLRAARRIGELTRELEKVGGPGRGKRLPPGGSLSKTETLKAAGISTQQASRCEQIAAVPEPEFESWIQERRAKGQPVSAKEVVAKVSKQAKRQEVFKNGNGKHETYTIADLHKLAASGKTFGTIYADPPWQYGNQRTRAATDNHYQTMTVEEVVALPVAKLAGKKSHLHLWTTNAFLFECPRILEAWGFEYKSVFVWVKPQLGIGNYWRVSHEFLVLGVRGDLTFDSSLGMKARSWLEHERGKHSAKPWAIRKTIEATSPGPRLELFGRQVADGWTVWGNQIDRGMFDADAEAR